jgi:hypothetical protein
MTPEPSPAVAALLGDERRAPLTCLAEGRKRHVRLGTRNLSPEAPSAVHESCEVFVRRPTLPARLSTRGGQFRAPRHSLRAATPMSKVPRLSSSWLARRDPLGSNGFEAKPGRVRPTDATHVVKDEHPCTGSQRRVSGKKPVAAAEPDVSMPPSPLLPADPARRTECCRLDATSWSWCLAPRHRPNDRRARARSPRPGRPRPLPAPLH